MSTEKLFFNGINAVDGNYFFNPMTPEELSALAKGESLNQDHQGELEWYKNNRQPHLGPKAGVDPKKLSQAGWGVIFACDEDPQVREALSELLTHRKGQAGDLYKELQGDDGYRYSIEDQLFESKMDFLAERGADTTGPVNPKKMPYYLLIVGDPEKIPYSFQYQLDVQYAVGRLHFDGADRLDKYARYARSVVEAEQGKLTLPRQATFFGVRNQDDPATNLSADYLVAPLADKMAQDRDNWAIRTFLKDQTKKAQLAKLLGGDQTPALLFTASHGMGFPNGHELQASHQGALLCQDWPGPREWHGQGTITPEYYFSADDVDDNANLWGLMAFHFACYGGGTPRLDDFSHISLWNETPIAPHAFVAGLPQRLLSHPKGGALAVVGHVERAWGYSFMWEGKDAQLNTFESTLIQLMEEFPVGAAVEYFNERYAELSTELTKRIFDVKTKKRGSELALSGVWTANNDARSYVIIGDPAVRLPVGDTSTTEGQRATIEAIEIRTKTTPTATPAPSPQPELSVEGPEGPTLGLPSEPAPTSEIPEAAVDFGMLDSLKQTKVSLTSALRQFSDKLGKTLEKAVDDVTSLEVATYVSDDMDGVKYDYKAGQFTGTIKLRALTRVNLDGDTMSCVPEKEGQSDKNLWAIHSDMVKQAQVQRAELFKTLVSAATGVMDVLKGL